MRVKRLIDVIGSLAALVTLSPVMAAIALAIWATMGRPIFYAHERVGRGFRRFKLYKFRTMVRNQTGPAVTVAGDPRVTPFGKFLRSTKLDELPQFWNVLKGDMSLVGPRPEVPEYVELYRDRYEKILQLRPGITDLASIRFRNEEEGLAARSDPLRAYVEEFLPAKLDLAEEYVRRRSLLLDLRILVQTALAVVRLA